jgi:hypothetical protein
MLYWKKMQFVKVSFSSCVDYTANKYKIDVEGFKVFQSKGVTSFLKQFEPPKKRIEQPKRTGNNGEIKIKIG